jgi:hypothetical protein
MTLITISLLLLVFATGPSPSLMFKTPFLTPSYVGRSICSHLHDILFPMAWSAISGAPFMALRKPLTLGV